MKRQKGPRTRSISATKELEAISTYKQEQKKILKDSCRSCGKKKHADRNTCPAKDAICPCGRKGHFQHLCFSKGKPRSNKKQEVENPNNSKGTDKDDTGVSGISASLFNVQSESDYKQVDDGKNVELTRQPEEISLYSLVFDKHNKNGGHIEAGFNQATKDSGHVGFEASKLQTDPSWGAAIFGSSKRT